MDTEKLLDELDQERQKFTRSDKEKMKEMVDLLVSAGIYPPMNEKMAKQGSTHLSMVESYGARWHVYDSPLECPHCKADLRNHESGPPFKREIGIEVRGFYDGVAYYNCPDCGANFSRQGTPLPDKYSLRRNEIFTV